MGARASVLECGCPLPLSFPHRPRILNAQLARHANRLSARLGCVNSGDTCMTLVRPSGSDRQERPSPLQDFLFGFRFGGCIR